MKVEGKFQVVDVTDPEHPIVESAGHNVFTNSGRQHVCDWLLHDNYSDDLSSPNASAYVGIGGRSLSDMKLVPYTDVSYTRVGTHSYIETPQNCLYPHNINVGNYMRLYSYNHENTLLTTYDNQYGTIFFDFTRGINLQAIMLHANQEPNWDYCHKFEIATSPNTYATSSSGDWTRRKFGFLPNSYGADGSWRHQMMLRFDDFWWPNKTISNVRSVRLRTFYSQSWTTWGSYWGMWFLEANHYPNTPSVIAIGTGSNEPASANTALQMESVRKFVRLHKTVGSYETKYSMRLESSEGNGGPYTEIGLLANPTKGGFIGLSNGPSICTTMIGRGLFSSSWSKTSGQVKDVDYSLTVTA